MNGIEPSADVYEMSCKHCGTPKADHVLEGLDEYSALHGYCVKKYLKTAHGKQMLELRQDIFVMDERGVLVLEYSDGALIFDAAEWWS